MQFTARDIEILKFINEFGFCEMPQIEKRFSLKKPRSYQIMKRLVDEELVTHERVFHGRHGIFYLTKKGAAGTGLPPIKGIPKDNYIHQLQIIEVHIQLRNEFPDAYWMSERRIRQEKVIKGVGKKNSHLPDGILVLPDLKHVAIEVELTMKSKRRLEDITWGYMTHKHIKETWYYCAPDVSRKVDKVINGAKGFKVYTLE